MEPVPADSPRPRDATFGGHDLSYGSGASFLFHLKDDEDAEPLPDVVRCLLLIRSSSHRGIIRL